MLLLLHTAFAAPACPEVVPLPAWTVELGQAEAAFAARDEAVFDEAMTQLADDLVCLDAVVEPALAGRYHRLVGLRLYARGDQEGARLAFAAARAVDPFGALPSELLPAGHEARELSVTAATPGAVEPVRPPVRGALFFDGKPSHDRPVDRPTVLQVQVGGGLETSRYLAPGDTMPAYPQATAHPVAHWILAGVAGAFAVGGGVCYGLALDAATTLDGPLPADTTREDVVALQQRANTLVVASAGAGVLGAAALSVTLVRW